MRFFIKFLEILTIVVGYGTIFFLAFELLKAHAIWIMPYLIWILLGLLVICICALAASWACHMEDNR
jgi:hypothetical protein